MRPDTARVPVGIWITTGILFTFFFLYAGIRYHHLLRQEFLPDFSPERLATQGENSVVIIGTSLIQHALPFDDELTRVAKQHNLPLKFIRITHSGNEYEPYLCLIEPLLEHPPRYLFLQAELFFLTYSRVANYQRHTGSFQFISADRLRFFYYAIRAQYHSILSRFTGRKGKPSPQSDYSIKQNLEKQADIEDILKPKYRPVVLPASFPEPFTAFIRKLQQQGTRVVLLEANRSEEGNRALGPGLRAQMTQTFQQAAVDNNMTFWQFPAIPLSYYSDRAHLNNRGRQIFTEWFLTRLTNEYTHVGF